MYDTSKSESVKNNKKSIHWGKKIHHVFDSCWFSYARIAIDYNGRAQPEPLLCNRCSPTGPTFSLHQTSTAETTRAGTTSRSTTSPLGATSSWSIRGQVNCRIPTKRGLEWPSVLHKLHLSRPARYSVGIGCAWKNWHHSSTTFWCSPSPPWE